MVFPRCKSAAQPGWATTSEATYHGVKTIKHIFGDWRDRPQWVESGRNDDRPTAILLV